MSHLTILKKNEVYLQIESEPHVFYELSDQFTFELPGAKFMPQYRNRYWDGKIRLFNTQNGEIYVGLLDKVIQFCKDHDYSYDFVDNKFYGLLAFLSISWHPFVRVAQLDGCMLLLVSSPNVLPAQGLLT